MIEVVQGDCRAVLATWPDACVEAVVTDPPYGLSERMADRNIDRARTDDERRRRAGGFMGQAWDADVPGVEVWREVLRVLKPGGHAVIFGGTRTYHRLACAVEDAGFEIRDCLMWMYGTGFPKSLDLSKALDKMAGVEREVVGPGVWANRANTESGRAMNPGGSGTRTVSDTRQVTAPATDAARQWQGWGTALKPAYEPILLARKPLVGTVAQNVLAHGTGALNIDRCRVPADENPSGRRRQSPNVSETGTLDPDRWVDRRTVETFQAERPGEALGRWPANVIHDGSDEVLAGFPDAGGGIGAGSVPVGDRGALRSRARIAGLASQTRVCTTTQGPPPGFSTARRRRGRSGARATITRPSSRWR